MMPARFLAFAVSASAAVVPAAAYAGEHATKTGHPVVVELFQSQGCSDCPPAQAYLNSLADRPDVLALSFAVTYWDFLGWRDSFASPQFTRRQRDYASAHGSNAVATPQYWVDGRNTVLGANPARVAKAIAASRSRGEPALTLSGAHLAIGAGQAPKGGADVWLVHYDPRTIQVAIRAGENGGRTLPHRDIVRALTKIGRWYGAALRLTVRPPADANWRTAVLVQAGAGGPILSAVKS